MIISKICKVNGCNKRYRARSLCENHYEYWRRTGALPKIYKYRVNQRHGMKNHYLYYTWHNIYRRCNDKSDKGYKYYGGRGIRLCKRWNNPKNFIDDMGDRPQGNHPSGYPKYTIERIDNDGDYEPSNCKWATMLEQSHNKKA